MRPDPEPIGLSPAAEVAERPIQGVTKEALWLVQRGVPAHAQGRGRGRGRTDGGGYAADLEGNLQSLLDRAKSGRYQAPPVRRVHIPKGTGPETRPIGIPTFEDKVLQRAVAMVLEAVYEQDFLDCSYGFRPGRSAHQALDALRHRLMEIGGGWVLEVDIRKFFDTLDHRHLREFLRRRVRDGVLLRLIGKWLKAGVLEDGCITHPESGSPQGGVVTPPTMLQTTLLGASFKRGWTDSIHDANLLLVDLDLLHQRPDDLPPCLPVRSLQPLGDTPRELLQLTDHQPQFRFLTLLAGPPLAFALQLGEAIPRRQHPRLEFRPLEQAVSVSVDHPRNRLFHIT